MSESLSMELNRRLRGMFVFAFGVESLEQSVKLDRLIILISLAIFPNRQPKGSAFHSVFTVRAVFSCCIAAAVAKENLLKTSAIVSLANF